MCVDGFYNGRPESHTSKIWETWRSRPLVSLHSNCFFFRFYHDIIKTLTLNMEKLLYGSTTGHFWGRVEALVMFTHATELLGRWRLNVRVCNNTTKQKWTKIIQWRHWNLSNLSIFCKNWLSGGSRLCVHLRMIWVIWNLLGVTRGAGAGFFADGKINFESYKTFAGISFVSFFNSDIASLLCIIFTLCVFRFIFQNFFIRIDTSGQCAFFSIHFPIRDFAIIISCILRKARLSQVSDE